MLCLSSAAQREKEEEGLMEMLKEETFEYEVPQLSEIEPMHQAARGATCFDYDSESGYF